MIVLDAHFSITHVRFPSVMRKKVHRTEKATVCPGAQPASDGALGNEPPSASLDMFVAWSNAGAVHSC